MGNLFCDCEKKTPVTVNIDAGLPDFEQKNKVLKSGPQSSIGVVRKPTSQDDFWNSLENSSLIGKGEGNPKEKYEFISEVGKGSFGVVYKAKLKKTGDLRAIKIIKKSDNSVSVTKKLIREIELLENSDHPNIIKIYEFYNCPDYVCIVSDFGKGGSLANSLNQIIKESETTKAQIMFQLLSAVNYCHNIKVMHRDIKPDNILIEKNKDGLYKIKLIDFGTAMVFVKNEHRITGTSHYIAPEVLSGDYNEKCDIWSCGVLCYVLFKGSFPFNGNTRNEIYRSIKTGKFDISSPPFDNVSDEAKDLIQKMLKMDPAERINASNALNHPWFQNLKIKDELSEIDFDMARKVLNNIYNYDTKQTLQKPVIAYLVHTFGCQSKYVNAASALFSKIDYNNDGSLGKNEFVKNLTELFKKYDQEIDENYLGKLFDIIDSDDSHKIGYTEFTCAAVDKKEFLSELMIQDAFDFFDKDKNGSITLEEVKKAFRKEKNYKENDFKDILNQIDLNKDAKIDYKEFKKMMETILQ